MARIHQLNPGNYRTSAQIDADMANIVRYLVASEMGDKSLPEMMAVLFDTTSGDLIAPVEIRNDSTSGLQYRVGTFTDETTGWITLATVAELRGTPGLNLGIIEGPLFNNPVSFTATASQTVFSYAFDETDDLFVFVDGVFQVEGGSNDYTKSHAADTVTFNSGMSGGEIVYIITVRASSVSNYRRSDIVSAGQVVFPFTHTEDEKILVFLNGLIQREGGANDYTTSPSSNTVTFTSTIPASDVVSIITVENLAQTSLSGLMTEDNYTNSSGLIPYAKLSIADNDIPQAKINGLTALLTNRGRIYVQASEPSSGMSAGDFWLNTSVSPNTLYVYDSSQWLAVSPSTAIPAFTSSNANQILHLNGTGTAMVWKAVDLSAYVANASVGAANGVASLDADARLPYAQLPEVLSSGTFYDLQSGAVSNAAFVITRIYKEKIRIDSRAIRLASGTCTWDLQVDGVTVATTTVSASSTPDEANFANSVEVDATSASKTIGFVVSSGSSPVDLDTALAFVRLSS